MSGISKAEWSIAIVVVVIVAALLIGWYLVANRTPKAPPIPPEVMRVLTPTSGATTTPPSIPQSVLQKLVPAGVQTSAGSASSGAASSAKGSSGTGPTASKTSGGTQTTGSYATSSGAASVDPALAPLLTPDPNAAPPAVSPEVLKLLSPQQ